VSTVHVFTSAALNYLPKVRALCRSLKTYHPELIVHFALADEVPDWLNLDSEPFDDVISIAELDIPEKRSWMFRHTIVELSTGIKPFVFQYLLRKPDCKGVLYFDPDIVLFSGLDDLLAELEQNNILLTPHQAKPEQSLEAVADNEICSLRHGIFNLGFLGVRNDQEGRNFVTWWSERIYHFCHESLENHLFTDQKWINFVPVFFDGVKILKHSRFNVATWNITTRRVAGSFRDGFTVDGAPLGFYHFTGFDSGAHEIMARKYGQNNPAVMSLVRWYVKEIQDGDENRSKPSWAFSSFSNGAPITKEHRDIYRMRRDLQEAFPDPFSVTSGNMSYYQWFEWCAALEHPELFSLSKPAPSSKVPTSNLVPRYLNRIDMTRVRRCVRIAVRDRRQLLILAQKAWRILRVEGLKGFKHRLASRREKVR